MDAFREDRIKERDREDVERESQREIERKGKARGWGGDDEVVRLVSRPFDLVMWV